MRIIPDIIINYIQYMHMNLHVYKTRMLLCIIHLYSFTYYMVPNWYCLAVLSIPFMNTTEQTA